MMLLLIVGAFLARFWNMLIICRVPAEIVCTPRKSFLSRLQRQQSGFDTTPLDLE